MAELFVHIASDAQYIDWTLSEKAYEVFGPGIATRRIDLDPCPEWVGRVVSACAPSRRDALGDD